MKSIGLFLALLGGSIQFGAHAQDISAYPCNGCNDVEMESLAVSKGLGFKHIYNLPDGIIVRYIVVKAESSTSGSYDLVAEPTIPDDWVLQEFVAIHNFYKSSGNSLDGIVAASANSETGGSVNAYDVTGSSVDRNRVSDALAAHPGMIFTSVMASFGRAIRLAGIVTPDVALTATVNFPDGSRVVYKFNWDTKKWEYVKGTGVDSNGNSVPESPNDFVNGAVGSGVFDFTRPGGNPNDARDFINRAEAAGVSITDGVRFACTRVNGGSLTCNKI